MAPSLIGISVQSLIWNNSYHMEIFSGGNPWGFSWMDNWNPPSFRPIVTFFPPGCTSCGREYSAGLDLCTAWSVKVVMGRKRQPTIDGCHLCLVLSALGRSTPVPSTTNRSVSCTPSRIIPVWTSSGTGASRSSCQVGRQMTVARD